MGDGNIIGKGAIEGKGRRGVDLCMEGGRERGREGERERGREGERERGREGERERGMEG